MRQPAHRQSAIRNPLNHILGTESGVRILRVLSQTRQPLSAADLARRTTLNPTGVRNTLEDLIGEGILTPVGGGSRRLVRLRPDHPLAPALRRLFTAEAGRIDTLRKGLGEATAELATPPVSVWLQGPVAEGTDNAGDTLTVGVLADALDLESIVETLREKIAGLERQQDVTIEIRGFSRADLRTISSEAKKDLTHAIPLWGPHPESFIQNAARPRRPSVKSHEALDARSRALAQTILRKLRTDPSLIERTRQRLAVRMRTASAGERKELQEWNRLLRRGSERRLRQFLADPGQRATRLRQTMPFLDALTPEERDQVLADTTSS